jgi:hypothetical protein
LKYNKTSTYRDEVLHRYGELKKGDGTACFEVVSFRIRFSNAYSGFIPGLNLYHNGWFGKTKYHL